MLDELINQMRQARQHIDRAAAMISQALTELDQAGVLVRRSLQGSADQTPTATVQAAQQRLSDAQQRATAANTAIDQVLARWAGTGSPGN